MCVCAGNQVRVCMCVYQCSLQILIFSVGVMVEQHCNGIFI